MKKWLDKYQNGREILFNKPIVPIVDDTYVKIPYISKPRKYNAEDIFVEPDKKYYIIHDNRTESDKIIHRRIGEELEKQKRLKAKLKSAVKVVDVASDLMQFGNFIPLPQAQVVGKWGNILGAGVDAFQAGMNVAENDYVNAGVNASSVLLPHIIENYGYKRDMFNTTPGSYADKIASFGNRSGQYIHLTPYVKHSSNPVIMKGVNFNRGLLGAVGVETASDLNQKQQGGPIVTNRGQWDYPGQTTIIPSNKITMTGVNYPVLGVDNTGYTKMMQPGMDYTFPGQYVTEYPMAQNGYQIPKADDTYVRLPYVTIPPKGGFKYRDFPKETLAIRQKAYDVIEPSSYLDIDNYTRWKTGEKRNSFSDPRSEEAWKFYLGLTNPDETSYIKKSKYRPTINAVKPYYYSVDPLLEKDIFNAYKDKVQLNKTLQTDESELETPLSGKNAAAMLGRFGVSKGHDEKGDYLSYYDKYDLKDFAQTRTKGLPYSIYGRIYYPKKEQGGEMISDYKSGGQHGGLDRWFAEKWVDIKTGRPCGRQEGESRNGYPACRPSKRISSDTPKTSSELSSSEKERFKREKTSSERISYNHQRREDGGEILNLELMKSGGNVATNPSLWSRAKSLARQKYDVYPCVPMDSQALTKEGWKYYNELTIGEEILAYNQETNKNEWTPIISLQKFEDAPIIRLYKKQTNFDIKCTPNHKWVLAENNSKYPDNLVEAKDITKHMTIKISAELSDNGKGLDLNKFLKKESWVKNILQMSIPQIQSYFASGIVYDGNDKGLDKKENKQTYGFSQKEKDHGLAMEIAAVLLGYRVCSIVKKHNPTIMSWTFIRRNTESTQNLHKEDAGISDVWCPTTKFGTWVMKQNGYVTITGNSAYANGWAAKWYKSHGGGWRKAEYGMEVMGDGGVPNNPGFNSLPEYVQQNIINNMATGGQKMPPQLAYARFAAAGNLNQLQDYGYEQGGVVLNAGGEKHRIYVKSTNRGEGVKGHIMVNHPTMDKGIWDTIDLTEKAGATTIAQGVAATKKWHRENPYKKQDGGEQYTYWRTGKPMVNDPSMDAISKVLLQRNLDKNFMQRAAGFGYQGGIPTRYIHGQDPNSNNISSLLMGSSDNRVFPTIIQTGPSQLSYQPDQTQEYLEAPSWDVADYFATKGYKRAANDMYGMEYKNGGYVVRRSHDRKGKTHVVIGPDGTKKYFGDPNMGERGKSKYGKEAFYARHKKNLAKNPYFRAYARATWEEGGETYAIGGQSTLNPIVKKDNRNWLDFLKN